MTEKDFLEPLDIKLLGGTKAEAETAFGDAVPTDAQGAPPWDLTAKTKIRKIWTLCQGAGPFSGSATPAQAAAQDDEQPLPEGMPEAIEAAWVKKHGFHLSGARLLVGGDYNRVYNCPMKKTPRELPAC